MSDGGKSPSGTSFPPNLHLQCTLEGDFGPNQELTPKHYVMLVFRRYVPNPDYRLADAEALSGSNDAIFKIVETLTGEHEPDWAEVMDMTAAFFGKQGAAVAAMPREMDKAKRNNIAAQTRKSAKVERQQKIAAFIDQLRQTDPSLFERKMYVVSLVQHWAAQHEPSFEVSDKTIEK